MLLKPKTLNTLVLNTPIPMLNLLKLFLTAKNCNGKRQEVAVVVLLIEIANMY